MRQLTAVLLALVAGVLAVLATAGALVDEAAHRPALVRQAAEQVAADDDVREAIPGAVADAVGDAVPEGVPGPLRGLAQDLVRPMAESAAQDEGVVRGWSDTADEARRAWLHDLREASDATGPVPGGDFTIPFGPVAQSGVAAALGDLETDLREDRLNLPGQQLVERLLGVDFGDWAVDTLVGPLHERAAELRDRTDLTMTVTVDALRDVDRSEVARWVSASVHWRWAAGGAVVLLAAAVLIAPLRWRGVAVLLSAATALVGGYLLANATRAEAFAVAAPEGAPAGIARLVERVEQALRPAVDAALAPYADGLTTAGWIALAVGAALLVAELVLSAARAGRTTPPRARGGSRAAADPASR